MNRLWSKIVISFKKSLKGEELTRNLIFWWGIPAYLLTYFVLNKLVYLVNSNLFDKALSVLVIIYFIWHIYAVRRSVPKKPRISKEEKKRIKLQKKKDFGKNFMRKLLLQESITKWDSAFVSHMVDLLVIVHFFGFL